MFIGIVFFNCRELLLSTNTILKNRIEFIENIGLVKYFTSCTQVVN